MSSTKTPWQVARDIHDPDQDAIRVLESSGFSAPSAYDAITVEYPSDTVEVYEYRTGGASGTIVMTITVTYVDDTKEQLVSVEKAV